MLTAEPASIRLKTVLLSACKIMPDPRQQERELCRDRQQRAGQDRGAGRRPHHQSRSQPRRSLGQDDQEHRHQQQRQVPGDEAGIDQHPDRDEEEAGENIAQRHDVAQDLVREVRFADDDPGHEGPERERQPEEGRAVGQAERRHADREHEDLPAAQPGDPVEDPGQHPQPDRDQQDQEEAGLGHFPDHVAGQVRAVGRHRREHDDQDHRGQVLHRRPGERQAAMGRIDLAGIADDLDQHRARRDRDHRAEEERFQRFPAECDSDPRSRSAMTASIWTVAPMVATLPERSSSASESSTPIANMSRMMPISARAVTVSSAATNPGVYGADRDAGEDIAEDDRLAEAGSEQRAHEAGPEREHEIDEEVRVFQTGADPSSGVRIGASAGQRRCSGQSNWRHKAKAMRNPAAGEPQRGNRGTLPPFSQPKPKSRN